MNIRTSGLIAVNLREDDELISVRLTDGTKDMIIGTKNGLLIRFDETDVRSMGRTATGVKGISLGQDDEVIGMEVLEEGSDILIVTHNGYGKRTPEHEYRVQNRGGKGIKTCNITEKTGTLVGMKVVNGEEDIMLITTGGILIRMDVHDISTLGRNTQGVRLIRLNGEDEFVATVAKVEKEEPEDEADIDDEDGAELNLESEAVVDEENVIQTEEDQAEDSENVDEQQENDVDNDE